MQKVDSKSLLVQLNAIALKAFAPEEAADYRNLSQADRDLLQLQLHLAHEQAEQERQDRIWELKRDRERMEKQGWSAAWKAFADSVRRKLEVAGA